ncbi:MAG: helix-turn-helix transcriptional regulator [Schwartzia sp.]|nr:helix-turn-helix transcriptional regulator [Schwartzia sp. (in: firmicutes)]MBR1761004.1 helix-turn-helix transcriptional regulator [Schwartzia sp. (in: firmicutes)]MBR1885800.1 helix-turn-helix transcriptional regulator [Schwartzia sp. (in: firmicutes)]
MQSNRLRYLREKEALTQTNVANALHIGQSTYNRYERGIREPDHETLKKIADYFHVSLDFLLKHDRPYTRKETDVDLAAFLLDGSYKIFSKTPTQKDRRKLVNILNALFSEENDGKKHS